MFSKNQDKHGEQGTRTATLFLCIDVLVVLKTFFVSVLPVCMYMHRMRAWCLWGYEEGVGPPGTETTGGSELSSGHWELNPGQLEEQQVL